MDQDRKKLIIDIETIPDESAGVPVFDESTVAVGNLKDPAKIAEKILNEKMKFESGLTKKMSIESDYCRIIALGWIEISPDWHVERGGVIFDKDGDKEIIQQFKAIYSGQQMIGWNLKGFDLPVIWKRGVLNGLRVFEKYLDIISKYKTDSIDLMHVWNNYEYGKMKDCAGRLGIESKTGMDGSMIYDAFKAGKHEEIKAYCKQDCEVNLAIAQRIL